MAPHMDVEATTPISFAPPLDRSSPPSGYLVTPIAPSSPSCPWCYAIIPELGRGGGRADVDVDGGGGSN